MLKELTAGRVRVLNEFELTHIAPRKVRSCSAWRRNRVGEGITQRFGGVELWRVHAAGKDEKRLN